MGRKIDALKWALTTRPNFKGAFRHELKEPPLKTDAGIIYLSAFLWFGIGAVVAVLTRGIFGLGVMMAGGTWFFRAFWKLRNEWIEETHDIRVKE